MKNSPISRICTVTFSPCGNVAALAQFLAQELSAQLSLPVENYDFTLPGQRTGDFIFHSTDLVIVGTPVYAGRVPNKIMPYIQGHLHGNGGIAIPLVAFGNRSYDNALIELRNLLENNAFHTIAATAVSTSHSFSDQIGYGRPDSTDLEQLRAFAEQICSKLSETSEALLRFDADSIDSNHISSGCCDASIFQPVEVPGENPPTVYYTPLGVDGKPAKFLKAVPKTDPDRCNQCGLCSTKCPMGSIDPKDPAVITGICIKCQACVRNCPAHAKYFDDPAFLSHVEMLKQNYTKPAKSEFFL